jgi:hypothetical protein
MRHSVLTLLLAGFALLPSIARAERAWAVDSRAFLIAFDTNRPGWITDLLFITGLQPGEHILAIDFRPATGQLYALGSSSRLYTVSLWDGHVTPVGDGQAFTPKLAGTEFGFDFNPTVDRIRIVSNSGQNLRAHPDTGRIVAVDAPLRYEDGTVPQVIASGYTNSFAGATSTALFNIDLAKRAIVLQSPPNEGVLGSVKPLINMDFTAIAGYDISPITNRSYLVMRESQSQRCILYELYPETGDHNPIGPIEFFEQASGLAIEPANVRFD